MTEPTIWDTLHGPVLRAAVNGINADRDHAGIRIQQIALETGIDDNDVLAALRALESAGYVELRLMMPARAGRVVRVFERAQRETGAWPTPESAAERLITALEHIATNTDDTDERNQLQKLAAFLRGSGAQVAVSVASAVITGQITQ